MESPASTAGPRVYVPISHPDSPVPTYAVLQFLGISPPPDPSSQPPLFSAAPPLLLPCSSPASAPSSPAPKRCASFAESSNSSSSDEKDRKLTSIKPSPMKKSASGTGLTAPALSPGARRNGKALPLAPTISITHTDKDTIIHTLSSNFREVVHQLTGATSGDKGLMPVTMPARTAITNRDKDIALPTAATSPSMVQIGGDSRDAATGRKLMDNSTTKLLERRKSNKVLERLSTSCRNLPPLVPSPVTPLASDFEKICLPITPTNSEGSLTPGLSSSLNLSPLSHNARAMESLSLSGAISSHANNPTLLQSHSAKVAAANVNRDAMDVEGLHMPHLLCSQSLSLHAGEVVKAPHVPRMPSSMTDAVMNEAGSRLALTTGVADSSLLEATHMHNGQEANVHCVMDAESLCDGESSSTGTEASLANDDEESIIAKKGFFFHSQRPRHGDTMLLALFPESPREL